MPIFDIRCKHCGKKWPDVFASAELEDIKQICSCGSREFEKLPCAPAVHFKGTGWTDPPKNPTED